MSLKKLGLGIFIATLLAQVTMTGCVSKTEEKVEVQNVSPAPVVIPDRKVDIHVKSDAK